ncbi:MAG: response regulator [Anaerolineae bacterium]|nr:response regulator [Anaerolineae bacterium]
MAKHALIIDDDPMSLEIMSQLLELEGFTFTAIQDSSLIDDVLAGLSRVDIVFLDLEMPSPDGYNVLKHLKNDIGMTAPIVAHTVHMSESNAALAMGFDAFISKPTDSDHFHEHLQQILKGERVWVTRHK